MSAGLPEGFPLSTPQVTFLPRPTLPADGRLLVYRPQAGADADPCADAASLHLPVGSCIEMPLAVPREGALEVVPVAACAIGLEEALAGLLADPAGSLPPWRRPPQTLLLWTAAARIALGLVQAHLVAPTLVPGDGDALHGVWKALVDDQASSRAAVDRIVEAMPPAGWPVPDGDDRLCSAARLVGAFLDAVADLCARRAAEPPHPGRPRGRLLPWTSRWREALADPHDSSVPLGDEADEILAGVQAWHRQGDASDGARTELRLEPATSPAEPWSLHFGVRIDDGELIDAARVWRADIDEHGDAFSVQEALMRGLGRCARVFEPLAEALREPEPTSVALDLDSAWEFIHAAAPLLAGTDVIPVLPEGLDEQQLGLRVRLHTGEDGDELDDEALSPGLLDGKADMAWEVVLGDEALSDADLERLLTAGRPLVHFRDRWVRVDPGVVQHLEEAESGSLPLADALLLGLAGDVALSQLTGAPPVGREPTVDVVIEGPLAGLLGRLRGAGDEPVEDEPPGFRGELRPYQRRGVAWLAGMANLGLGAVLADEMGLGKTVQLIAHLLRRPASAAHLVVCPTSVVGNWEREIIRFAPDLQVTRFHGPDRPTDLNGVRGVVVTSYGILRREADVLAAVDWDVVTLDEAQHIKNPSTAGARAARRLPAQQTVVMTGTPLENRLAELWALLDVTNRGLLGSRARFGRRFVAPVERHGDAAAAARLRRLVAPFVLRRRKSDPAVVTDLPEKIERTVACTLTAEQARMYQEALDRVFAGPSLEATSPMERRGRILALLTELKQICNHPAHYLRERGADAPPRLTGRSGKLAAAREILGAVTAAGERALVFTQFVEMGHLLVAQLSADLGVAVDFLHGGVPAGARDRMVSAFQGAESAPVLVVSLRAGGTGLNLTAATHVVHYDRWWNPAVEDQATDRVHRIGQFRTVEVHKLVTAGTVEERIAELLERKRSLAEQVVGEGERWITELGDAELRELVALSAPGEDIDDDEPVDGWGGALEEAI